MRTLTCGAIIFGLATTSAWSADTEAGKTLYASKCRTCHAAGQGNPAMAKALKVDMRDLGSAEVQAKSDSELKKNFAAGVGKMKAVAGLSAGDQDNLVAYLRTLKK